MTRLKKTLTRLIHHLAGWRVGITAAAITLTFVIGSIDPPGSTTGRALWLTVMVAGPMTALLAIIGVDGGRTAEILERLTGRSGRVPQDIASLAARLDLLDIVLADQSRRPWDPTLLPWALRPAGAEPKPVLLLPGAAYHLPEIVALAHALEDQDRRAVIAVGYPHWDRVAEGLFWYGDLAVHAVPEPEEAARSTSAVVTMKDWAGYAPIITAAQAAGIPTFAKVEGAQDFHDIDTNQARQPYRTADHILCQGQNDFDGLEGKSRFIVGSTRLERLWWAPPSRPHKPMAVINLNFTYGVLTAARKTFLETAIQGCELADIDYVIAVHPAEKARKPHPRSTTVPISRLLERATLLISRFSTVPFEAMARGVPFIYHNPHGELVQTFANPDGAFDTTTTPAELTQAIRDAAAVKGDNRSRSKRFFLEQVDIDDARTSETRTTAVLLDIIGSP